MSEKEAMQRVTDLEEPRETKVKVPYESSSFYAMTACDTESVEDFQRVGKGSNLTWGVRESVLDGEMPEMSVDR